MGFHCRFARVAGCDVVRLTIWVVMLFWLIARSHDAIAAAPPADPVATSVPSESLEDWIWRRSWVKRLAGSMPHGVNLAISAEELDEKGWMSVEVRESHAADSGLDPDVSPMVGMFRISRNRQVIEWMEPVSGEYLPLAEFIRSRNLDVSPDVAQVAMPVLGLRGGDFESAAIPVPGHDGPRIVPEPDNPHNHVARITGPGALGFALPLTLPEGTTEATISLRLLHPLSTALTPFDDGRIPGGIRLRVRLIGERGNSAVRDAVVRPTGHWRQMDFTFYDLPSREMAVSIEAVWMEGPVYVDDVRFLSSVSKPGP